MRITMETQVPLTEVEIYCQVLLLTPRFAIQQSLTFTCGSHAGIQSTSRPAHYHVYCRRTANSYKLLHLRKVHSVCVNWNLSGLKMWNGNCNEFDKHTRHDKGISDYLEAKYEESVAMLREDISKYQAYWIHHIEESLDESERLEEEIAELCQRRCSEDAERKTALEQEEIAEYVSGHSLCNDAEEKLASLHKEVLEYLQQMDVNGDHANYWKIRCMNAERRVAVVLHDEKDYGLGWRSRCNRAERNAESLSKEVEEYKLRLAKEKERVVELKCILNHVLVRQWAEMDECCLQGKLPNTPICPHLYRLSDDDDGDSTANN